jgi:molybdopterin converting factor subunit 1
VIRVTVKLFAAARDIVGDAETEISLPAGATAADVLASLASTHPAFAAWRDHVRLAVNYEYVAPDVLLNDRDEVAVIPPVSGG